jgi:hypothetical protein
VPGGAALVTLALLGYALIADGLGLRTRVRSYTQIDQRRGQSVSWARQSYYAGLAPSRGLKLPADVACYPIEQFPQERGGTPRSLVWDDEQKLLSGYLASRSTSQFMLIQSRPSTARLEIVPVADPSAPLRVINRLNTVVQKLGVRNADGKYYWGTNLAAGKEATLQSAELATIQRELRAALLANRPSFPPGYDARYYNRGFGFGRSYYYNANDQGLPAPKFDAGLLERSLSLAAYTPLEPRSYVAITQTAPEVPLISGSAREEASFHVVTGRW